jgi:mono/diheme cytochrome c family protein
MNKLFVKIGMFAAIISLASCGNDSSPGYEYMPNMYRSPSIETYEEHNIEGYNGMPVEGTISQGNLSTFNYTETEYDLAGSSATYPSDFIKDSKTMASGEDLYVKMCAHCHGPKGDGKGTITHPIYSAVPSYSNTKMIRRSGSTMSELTEGHIFHAITYGINAMGPHASQISEEERWKIVYYIQENLQNNLEIK